MAKKKLEAPDLPEKTKIIFMGTPEFADIILRRLIEKKYNLSGVFTKPPQKIGRKKIIQHSVVAETSKENGLELFETLDISRSDLIGSMKKIEPDLIIVAAFGKIIPQKILNIPKYGALNIHASLLPDFRGASPIQTALLEGRKKTGISIMLMDSGIDTGKIISKKSLDIEQNDDQISLSKKLALLGADTLVKILPAWLSGKIEAVRQNNSAASYAPAIRKEDGEIGWNAPAEAISRKERAFRGWPGIHTFFHEKGQKKRLKIIEMDWLNTDLAGEKHGKIIEYKNKIAIIANPGLVCPLRVQAEGKNIQTIQEFVRGKKNILNTTLG